MAFRLPPRAGLGLCLVLVFLVSTLWTSHAQQQPGTSVLDTKEMRIVRRSWEPGARTNWHTHSSSPNGSGQLLFVQKGRMRVQARGQAMKELAEGESHYTPAGVEHWHGATPQQAAIQVSVNFGPEVTGGKDVTDGEYSGKAAR